MRSVLLSFLFFVFLIGSACDSYKLDDIQGSYHCDIFKGSSYALDEFPISGDTLIYLDRMGMKRIGMVSIQADSLKFTLPFEKEILTKIDHQDSIVYFRGAEKRFISTSFSSIENTIDFSLPSIKCLALTFEEEFIHPIHFLKIDGKLALRYRANSFSLHEVPLLRRRGCCGGRPCPEPPYPIIVLSDEIDLLDIKKLYFFLHVSGDRVAYLVVNRNGDGAYEGILDHFNFWNDRSFGIGNEDVIFPPPPPLMFERNSADVLAKGALELLIRNSSDVDNLMLKENQDYILNVSSRLALQDYIRLNLKLKQMHNKNCGRWYVTID